MSSRLLVRALVFVCHNALTSSFNKKGPSFFSPNDEGAAGGRTSRVTALVLGYGVGSKMDAPKMSLLPKVAGQSLFGAGFGTGLPVSKDWR